MVEQVIKPATTVNPDDNSLQTNSEPELPKAPVSISDASKEDSLEQLEPTPARLTKNTIYDDVTRNLTQQSSDLHELISPVQVCGALRLAEIDNILVGWSEKNEQRNSILGVNILDLSSLITSQGHDFTVHSNELLNALDNLEDPFRNDAEAIHYALGTSAGITTSISLGYILWLIRGGTLMGSVLAALPAWQLVDPLPILDSVAEDLDDTDDESLESIVASC